jgi:hypothetical protein
MEQKIKQEVLFPSFREGLSGKKLIFCFRMIKLNFVFQSNFQDGNMSPRDHSFPSNGKGETGRGDLKWFVD